MVKLPRKILSKPLKSHIHTCCVSWQQINLFTVYRILIAVSLQYAVMYTLQNFMSGRPTLRKQPHHHTRSVERKRSLAPSLDVSSTVTGVVLLVHAHREFVTARSKDRVKLVPCVRLLFFHGSLRLVCNMPVICEPFFYDKGAKLYIVGKFFPTTVKGC